MLSPLASFNTQFDWGFLWLSCGWLAALVANCLGRPAGVVRRPEAIHHGGGAVSLQGCLQYAHCACGPWSGGRVSGGIATTVG